MILPDTGRWQREALTEGNSRHIPLHKTASGPPPHSGEEL